MLSHYSAVHVNDWGEVASKQIQEGTRRFLEAYPAVDPKRVGCIGASYGGFMTLYLTTDGDLYAAAVSHAGISSISSYWGEGNWGYSYGALATADPFPWNRRDIYVERSPLFRADRSKTPTLLSHGASDTNVPAGESESFYTALKLLGTPVELLEVEGQDHWIVEHDKRAVWSRSIVGIMLGLVVGKQLGVFTFAWLAVKLGLARLPSGVDFKQVYGVAIICGIGFTMSLFIGMLAFENTSSGEVIVTDRLGVLSGSLISAIVGYVVLHLALPRGRSSHH